MHRRLLFCLFVLGACVDRVDAGAFAAPPDPPQAGSTGPNGPPDPTADGGGPGAPGGPTVHLDAATTALASGGLATCAVDAAGGVVCWGDNTHGALGFGDFTPASSASPMAVKGLASGVRAVAGGVFAQCAILNDGTARCWGDSLFGDAGGGATTHVQVPWPHDKLGLSNDVAQIAFGAEFACALTTSGRAKCWGLGGAGQLGTGTTDDAYVAHDIAGVKEPMIAIAPSMGGLFACAAGASGKAYCWGENGKQELGTTEAGGRPTPAPVPGLDGKVVAVGAGRAHACALYDDGGVACWGGDERGQLGRGATSSAAAAPARVAGVIRAKSLVVGSDHACATLADGSVACWGANDVGQITDRAAGSALAPTTAFASSFGAVAVGAGFMHTCAMSATRRVSCRGAKDRAQIGAGDFAL